MFQKIITAYYNFILMDQEISYFILLKEVILLILRLNLLKKIIKNLIIYYIYMVQ